MKNTELSNSRISRIVELHQGILASARRSVADAIEIGKLLEEQKAELDHGAFLPWVERELPFHRDTAVVYMRVYRHADKCRNARHLQEAERVAQIEDSQIEAKRIQDMRSRIQRGEAPPTDRSDKRLYKKLIEDDGFEERKERAFQKAKEDHQQKRRQRLEALGITFFGNYSIDEVIEELRTRVLAIPEISRRHEIINKVIRSMRDLAIECDRISAEK